MHVRITLSDTLNRIETIDVIKKSTINGDSIQQWTLVNGQANQEWSLQAA